MFLSERKKLAVLVSIVTVLSACGGEESLPDGIDLEDIVIDGDKVTLPDGTVIDRPDLSMIKPDQIPLEMLEEYQQYVEATRHQRDPRGQVYEYSFIHNNGTEDFHYTYITPEGRVYTFDYLGDTYNSGPDCYAGSALISPNAGLVDYSVIQRPDQDGYTLSFGNSSAGYHRVNWLHDDYGFVETINLTNAQGAVLESSPAGHLIYGNEHVNPFLIHFHMEAVSIEPSVFYEKRCATTIPPIVYQGGFSSNDDYTYFEFADDGRDWALFPIVAVSYSRRYLVHGVGAYCYVLNRSLNLEHDYLNNSGGYAFVGSPAASPQWVAFDLDGSAAVSGESNNFNAKVAVGMTIDGLESNRCLAD